MGTSAGQGRICGDPQRCEVRRQGYLDSRWADGQHGTALALALALALESDGTTTLTGSVADQSALHGLPARIRALALSIVSIRRLSPEEDVGNS